MISDGKTCFYVLLRVGYPCPEMFNPADHYVHVLAITPGKEEECKARVRAICQEFRKSEEGRLLAHSSMTISQSKHILVDT